MKKIIAILLSIVTFNALANSAMVFPQRAILNEKNKSANFKVINPGDNKVTYDISLVDRVQDASGTTSISETYVYSAKNNIKYTPRKSIALKKNGKKPIRVKLTDYAKLADGEYRSYLNIITAPNKPTQEGYSVQMRTGIQLPIIIRKGNLTASLSLDSTYDSKKVQVTLKREGNRSVHGDINIIQHGTVIGESNSTAVYIDTTTATYGVAVENFDPTTPYVVEFKESEESGDIKVTQTFNG